MSKYKTCWFLSILIIASSGIVKADYDLQFEHYIDDGSPTPYVDTFNAIGSTDSNVLVGYDSNDVNQPSAPSSGDYVQAYTEPNGIHVTKDYRPLDVNVPDLIYPIKLFAFDDGSVGLTGTAYFDLLNPEALDDVPPEALVILTRYDGGVPVLNYDLRDPNNHSISWPIIGVQGEHTTIELRVIKECLRVASLYPEDPNINLVDYAVLTNGWMQVGPLDGDINGNNITDMNDLAIMVDYYLRNCNP